MDANTQRPRATFTSMKESTAEDWTIIRGYFPEAVAGTADRVLAHFSLLGRDTGGFPVDRTEHSLQCATRAHRAGEAEDYVVMALLHDIGDTLCPYNHPYLAAAILEPFVSKELAWIVRHHGIFQGNYFFHHVGMDRDMRESYRGHAYFESTARFCEKYDQSAFDPAYDSAPLEFFEPMVRRIMAKPLRGPTP